MRPAWVAYEELSKPARRIVQLCINTFQGYILLYYRGHEENLIESCKRGMFDPLDKHDLPAGPTKWVRRRGQWLKVPSKERSLDA